MVGSRLIAVIQQRKANDIIRPTAAGRSVRGSTSGIRVEQSPSVAAQGQQVGHSGHSRILGGGNQECGGERWLLENLTRSTAVPAWRCTGL